MEKEEKKEKKNNSIILLVIGIATLLVSLVGATFAFFSATLSKDVEESIEVSTANPVGLAYEGGVLSLLNAIPGDHTSNEFTITNPTEDESGEKNTVEQKYTLDMIIDSSSITAELDPDQLFITITSDITTPGKDEKGNIANTVLNKTAYANPYNLTDGTLIEGNSNATGSKKAGTKLPIVVDQRIAIGEVHTYTVEIEFKETEKNQNENKDKDFVAHIEISNIQAVK